MCNVKEILFPSPTRSCLRTWGINSRTALSEILNVESALRIFHASQSFLTTQRASVSECSNVCVCASGRARTRTRADVYNDTAKAAPHVSHYDFSALLLIKMQIYRGGGASERERSGGKTDYVWGRHDKHRNMINSTQPHPGTPTPPPSPRPPAVPSPFIPVLPSRHPLTRRISFFPPSNFPDLSSPCVTSSTSFHGRHVRLSFPSTPLAFPHPFSTVQIQRIVNAGPWKPCQAY